jgi:hypothetical protein
MLERHVCESTLESERDHEIDHETQERDATEAFSPRDHQAGFWS